MEKWDIRSPAMGPHRPQVLRSDGRDGAIAIRLPSGEELQQHHVHERPYLDVADSEIEISQDDSSVTGGTGFLSHFEPSERWTVRAEGRAAGARARPWSWAAHAGS
jgi:hypothetical protein